jgi:hypothetical protein
MQRHRNLSIVITGHSRPKDGVASLAYVPVIPLKRGCVPKRDGRYKPGHDKSIRNVFLSASS